jgi:hypothetical protein
MAYGFETYDSAGNLGINSDISTIRIVREQFLGWNYSGSFSVPNFNSSVGEFYIKPHLVAGAAYQNNATSLSLTTTGTNYNYNFKGTQVSTGGLHEAGWWLSFQNNNKPTLSWNNSSKLMTVTAPSISPLYRSSTNFYEDGGDYTIVFFEVA